MAERETRLCAKCGILTEHGVDPKYRCVVCDQKRKHKARGLPKTERVVLQCKDKVSRQCGTCREETLHYVENPVYRCLVCDRNKKKAARARAKERTEANKRGAQRPIATPQPSMAAHKRKAPEEKILTPESPEDLEQLPPRKLPCRRPSAPSGPSGPAVTRKLAPCKAHNRTMWRIDKPGSRCDLCVWYYNHKSQTALTRSDHATIMVAQGEKCPLCNLGLFDPDLDPAFRILTIRPMGSVDSVNSVAPGVQGVQGVQGAIGSELSPTTAQVVHDLCRDICRPQAQGCGTTKELLKTIVQRHDSLSGPPPDNRPTVGIEEYVFPLAQASSTDFQIAFCGKHQCSTLHCKASGGRWECRLCRGNRKVKKKVDGAVAITHADQLAILAQQEHRCAVCGGRFEIRQGERCTSAPPPLAICWPRVDCSLPDVPANVHAAHQRCYAMRNRTTMSLQKWYRHVKVLCEHL